MLAFPAYAGHLTITETDTQIYVEYYGDDKDIQDGSLLKEEQRRNEEQAAKDKERFEARQVQNAARNIEKMKRREE
mgnify:CR=1 FL=1